MEGWVDLGTAVSVQPMPKVAYRSDFREEHKLLSAARFESGPSRAGVLWCVQVLRRLVAMRWWTWCRRRTLRLSMLVTTDWETMTGTCWATLHLQCQSPAFLSHFYRGASVGHWCGHNLVTLLRQLWVQMLPCLSLPSLARCFCHCSCSFLYVIKMMMMMNIFRVMIETL